MCFIILFALIQPHWLTGHKTPTYLLRNFINQGQVEQCWHSHLNLCPYVIIKFRLPLTPPPTPYPNPIMPSTIIFTDCHKQRTKQHNAFYNHIHRLPQTKNEERKCGCVCVGGGGGRSTFLPHLWTTVLCLHYLCD